MSASAFHSAAGFFAHRPGTADPRPTMANGAGAGVGGNTVAHLLQENCAELRASAGVVIEYLDTQAGTWQFSLDDGQTWRAIRTDLINRPGHMGLALDRDARLRVLCTGASRDGARVVLHAVQRSHGSCNGSYRPYAPDEREEASCSVTLVLGLGAINGVPPAVKVPRPRNKRARALGAATGGEKAAVAMA
ncbi:hypothetical protein [Acidovorax carolinensis]|uniref:hypothetical protein n=1 Tax=Acidovorax carolinensis TaxID=553814 RepID=UPI000B341527|nr:hypothetical protein [Acidovorax carolinensis]ART49016.1 hypothetical protein CBP33_13510 [Acidovorax carolinensis]